MRLPAAVRADNRLTCEVDAQFITSAILGRFAIDAPKQASYITDQSVSYF
jgi:hypothetical protein